MPIAYLISEKHTHKLLFPTHFAQLVISLLYNALFSDLLLLEGLHWMVSFFFTSSPFLLVVFFVLLLLKPVAMVNV